MMLVHLPQSFTKLKRLKFQLVYQLNLNAVAIRLIVFRSNWMMKHAAVQQSGFPPLLLLMILGVFDTQNCNIASQNATFGQFYVILFNIFNHLQC